MFRIVLLPQPGGPQEDAELAHVGLVLDRQVHVVDGLEGLPVGVHEGLGDVLQLQDVGVGGRGLGHHRFQEKSCLLMIRMTTSLATPMARITMTPAKIWSTWERLPATVMMWPRP